MRDVLPLIKRYAPQAKVIFYTIDLHFLREKRDAELKKDQKLLEAAKRLKKEEVGMMQAADHTILLSNAELEIIKEIDSKIETSYLPIWQDVPGPVNSFEQRKNIVFVGGFAHTPNVDAVQYFVAEIWPDVIAKLPNLEFHIVGNNIPDSIKKLASDSIKIIGFVPKLKDVFEPYRLSVAPLRFGAVQKGKVVSSLCHGLPCIATSIAAEGIGLKEEEEIIVTDNPKVFAEKIIDTYQDKKRCVELSQAGLKFAQQHLSEDLSLIHI